MSRIRLGPAVVEAMVHDGDCSIASTAVRIGGVVLSHDGSSGTLLVSVPSRLRAKGHQRGSPVAISLRVSGLGPSWAVSSLRNFDAPRALLGRRGARHQAVA